jgi:integrase/recombinase XerD
MKALCDLLQEYIGEASSLNLSPHTLRTGRYHCHGFLIWLQRRHAVRSAEQLRRDVLQRWQKHLSAHRTAQGLPLKARSVNRQIESVRSFLSWLVRRGQVPALLLDGLTFVKEPHLLPTSVLNHGQVRQLLDGVSPSSPTGWRDRLVFELLYTTGVRASELLGLNVADVDLRNATALVLGKGNKQRMVPIGQTALRLLESYLRAVRPFLLRDQAEPALLLDQRGRRLRYHTLLRLVHHHTAQAGLPATVTPHTFRRSCATEMIRGGANLYHVKELLGHESLETLKHYTRLTIQDLKKTHRQCHPRERMED